MMINWTTNCECEYVVYERVENGEAKRRGTQVHLSTSVHRNGIVRGVGFICISFGRMRCEEQKLCCWPFSQFSRQ
jgi:hypothetical protein